MAQKLSPTAKRMKAIRDKRAAMTDDRRLKKAENQRKRRAAIKAGKFKSVSKNRGNDGSGTKREGKKNYFTTKTMKKT